MSTPEFILSIATALAAAQLEFLPIHRDRTVKVRMKNGGEYTFAYAPLESILAAVMPALNKHGFALVQRVEGEPVFSEEAPPRGEFITTTLYHASGELSNRTRIIISEPGPQAYGSALTYARRYGVTLLLGVCADEDDDANAAEGNQATARDRKPEPVDEKRSLEAKLLASNFKAAFDMKNDAKIAEVHDQANADQELYTMAWKLLDAPTRRSIKLSIDRVKHGNGAA